MAEFPTQKLTNRQLKFSYWYITHKLSLRKKLAIFLVLVSLVSFGYSIWQLIFYFGNYEYDQASINRMINGSSIALGALENSRPSSLNLGSIQAMPQEGSITDFSLTAQNPNPNWLSTFDYQFVKPGVAPQTKSAFVLPGETKDILDASAVGTTAEFKIFNQQWRKISNYDALKNDYFHLTVSNENFSAGQKPGDPNIVTFDLLNDSAYGFWQVGVRAYLLSGGEVVSSNYLTLDQLRASESRNVSMSWNHRLPRIDQINVVPEVNFLDENNIMKIGE